MQTPTTDDEAFGDTLPPQGLVVEGPAGVEATVSLLDPAQLQCVLSCPVQRLPVKEPLQEGRRLGTDLAEQGQVGAHQQGATHCQTHVLWSI